MLLAAILDAGGSLTEVNEALEEIGAGCFVESSPHMLAGIACRRVSISSPKKQKYRYLRDILDLFRKSSLSTAVCCRCEEIFSVLAEAEAKVHGCSPEEVHFHEIGGSDTIADVVGVIVGLETLRIDALYCSALPLASGWVQCEHGVLPLPAPAVCEILKNVPVYGVSLDAELVTPTGAALVKSLAAGFGPAPGCSIEKIGYGAGSSIRADGKPNLLRILVGTAEETMDGDEVEVIETFIDDWHPEGIGYLSEKLLAHGALDVAVTAVQMKKNRPGVLLRVLAASDKAQELKRMILEESTAIGLRYRKERRLVLDRRRGLVETRWGKTEVKLVQHPSGPRLHPEYESCRKLAILHNIALQEVYDAVACSSVDDFMEEG